MLRLLLVAALGYGAARISRRVDWDFLLLTTAVLLLWIAAFCAVYRASPPRRIRGVTVAAVCLLPLGALAAARRAEPRWPDIRLALNRYIVYNPSFRLSERLLARGDTAGMAAFRAPTPEALETALRQAFALDAPALVHVPVGAMPSPWDMILLPRVRGFADAWRPALP